jgi:hypothetical protein
MDALKSELCLSSRNTVAYIIPYVQWSGIRVNDQVKTVRSAVTAGVSHPVFAFHDAVLNYTADVRYRGLSIVYGQDGNLFRSVLLVPDANIHLGIFPATRDCCTHRGCMGWELTRRMVLWFTTVDAQYIDDGQEQETDDRLIFSQLRVSNFAV